MLPIKCTARIINVLLVKWPCSMMFLNTVAVGSELEETNKKQGGWVWGDDQKGSEQTYLHENAGSKRTSTKEYAQT